MFEDALISPEGMALLFGSTPVTGATTISTTEVLTVATGNVITLSHTPLGINGADKFFFTTADGASLGVEHVYASTPATGKYQITGTTVTFFTDVPAGTLIIATYDYTSAATTKKIKIDSDKFPGTYEITGECFFRLESGIDVPANFAIRKAKILPGFTITMAPSGESSVFSFSADVLKGTGTNNMVEINILE